MTSAIVGLVRVAVEQAHHGVAIHLLGAARERVVLDRSPIASRSGFTTSTHG